MIYPARALIALLALLVAASMAPSARAQEAGVLEGQVSNGTPGGPPPADVTVTVHIIQDRAKVGERVVRTGADGRFVVDGLPTAANVLYFPIVDYGGTIYYPDQPIVFGDATTTATSVTVYEPSRSPEGVAFERSNMLIMSVSPTQMTVMEMGAVVNRSDRAYVGDDQGQTVRWSLPPGATNVAPQTGLPPDTLESLPDGFATTDAIRPGRREVAFSYQLPFDSSTLDVVRRQALPVEAFTLYLPDTGLGVVTTGLVLQGSAELGGQRFQQYVARNVPPGGELQFRLTGLPAPFSLKLRDLGLVVAGVSALLLAAVLAGSLRRRARAAVADGEARPGRIEDAEHLRRVQALATLDERYAAGEIDEDAYRVERDRDKRRLAGLLTTSQPT